MWPGATHRHAVLVDKGDVDKVRLVKDWGRRQHVATVAASFTPSVVPYALALIVATSYRALSVLRLISFSAGAVGQWSSSKLVIARTVRCAAHRASLGIPCCCQLSSSENVVQ